MSSGIMETMAQSQMECPEEVYCRDCGWCGYEDELLDKCHCPKCYSRNIYVYNEKEYNKLFNKA